MVFVLFGVALSVFMIFNVFLGPPGTGKTYVGLKIMKTLISNLYSPGPGFEDERKSTKYSK